MTAVCHFKFSDVQDYKLLRSAAEILQFWILKMAAAAILDFSKFEILTVFLLYGG